MQVQFATDGVPAYRRLALWQDIVCDVYVQLDCKSDLGSAFNGRVTRSSLGEASCSEVSSQQQRVYRTRSRIARQASAAACPRLAVCSICNSDALPSACASTSRWRSDIAVARGFTTTSTRTQSTLPAG